MDDGLRRLLNAAKEQKQLRMPNRDRVCRFKREEEEILRRFAKNCDAAFCIQQTDSFIRVKITGDVLLISDMDNDLKRLLQDENVSVTLQAEQGEVIMEVVIRCFSSPPLQ